jgi:hypothetical protein
MDYFNIEIGFEHTEGEINYEHEKSSDYSYSQKSDSSDLNYDTFYLAIGYRFQ